MDAIESVRSTGEVAAHLSHGRSLSWISEPALNAYLRRRPHLAPPLTAGRRAWRAADVERLVEALRADGRLGAAS